MILLPVGHQALQVFKSPWTLSASEGHRPRGLLPMPMLDMSLKLLVGAEVLDAAATVWTGERGSMVIGVMQSELAVPLECF